MRKTKSGRDSTGKNSPMYFNNNFAVPGCFAHGKSRFFSHSERMVETNCVDTTSTSAKLRAKILSQSSLTRKTASSGKHFCRFKSSLCTKFFEWRSEVIH